MTFLNTLKIEPVVKPHERWIRRPTNLIITAWLVLAAILPFLSTSYGLSPYANALMVRSGAVDILYPSFGFDLGLFQAYRPDQAMAFQNTMLDLMTTLCAAVIAIIALQIPFSVFYNQYVTRVKLRQVLFILVFVLLSILGVWLPFSGFPPGFSLYVEESSLSRSPKLPLSVFSSYLFVILHTLSLFMLGSLIDAIARAISGRCRSMSSRS